MKGRGLCSPEFEDTIMNSTDTVELSLLLEPVFLLYKGNALAMAQALAYTSLRSQIIWQR